MAMKSIRKDQQKEKTHNLTATTNGDNVIEQLRVVEDITNAAIDAIKELGFKFIPHESVSITSYLTEDEESQERLETGISLSFTESDIIPSLQLLSHIQKVTNSNDVLITKTEDGYISSLEIFLEEADERVKNGIGIIEDISERIQKALEEIGCTETTIDPTTTVSIISYKKDESGKETQEVNISFTLFDSCLVPSWQTLSLIQDAAKCSEITVEEINDEGFIKKFRLTWTSKQ